MAATTLSGGISYTIEEDLSMGIQESLPKLDNIFKYLFQTWMGVEREGIGRDWQVIHTFSESLSGAFKWTSMAGSAVDQDTLTHALIPTATRAYPGLEDSVLPRYLQKKVTLVEGLGNLFVPQQYLRADKLSTSIGSTVADIIKGTAMLSALADIACWYNTNSAKSVIGVVGNNPDAGSSAVCHIKGAINMFYTGMHVDVYTGSSKKNTVQVVVDGVDYLPGSTHVGYGTVTLKTKDGSSIDIAANDLIVWADSYDVGPQGPSYWLVNTGTVFNINVATYAQFKSVVGTSVGDLDEAKLNQYFSRLWKAYGTMNFPDTIMTSMGVTTALIDSSYGLAPRFNRDLGQRNTLAMGFDEPGEAPYIFNGIRLRWLVSPYMPSDSTMSTGSYTGGRLWALKTRDNNLVRYVPPPLPNVKRHSQFGAEVEFPFGNTGPDGVFFPYTNTTGRLTEWYQAPFNRHTIYMPKFMPGLNLSGITEQL